jgi:hypothetical protein
LCWELFICYIIFDQIITHIVILRKEDDNWIKFLCYMSRWFHSYVIGHQLVSTDLLIENAQDSWPKVWLLSLPSFIFHVVLYWVSNSKFFWRHGSLYEFNYDDEFSVIMWYFISELTYNCCFNITKISD